MFQFGRRGPVAAISFCLQNNPSWRRNQPIVRHCNHRRRHRWSGGGDFASPRRSSRRRLRALRRFAPDRLRPDAAADRPCRAGAARPARHRGARRAHRQIAWAQSTRRLVFISAMPISTGLLRHRRSSRSATWRALASVHCSGAAIETRWTMSRRRHRRRWACAADARRCANIARLLIRGRHLRRALLPAPLGRRRRPRAPICLWRGLGERRRIAVSPRRRSPNAMSARGS